MKHMKGRILDGNNVIAENVDIVINESASSSGLRSWRGSFEVPSDVIVEAGMSLKLILEDGRSGSMLIQKIMISSERRSKLIQFIGSGPLE